MLRLIAALMCIAGPATAGEANRLLSQRSDAADLLAQQVRSAGYGCASVGRMFYKGEAKGSDYFAVRCDDGDYIISIENSGGMKATILDCAIAKTLGLECWSPF